MRLLLIEDEITQLKKLKDFLEDAFPDFHIDTAQNIDMARIKIIESKFDVGIFDIFAEFKF